MVGEIRTDILIQIEIWLDIPAGFISAFLFKDRYSPVKYGIPKMIAIIPKPHKLTLLPGKITHPIR